MNQYVPGRFGNDQSLAHSRRVVQYLLLQHQGLALQLARSGQPGQSDLGKMAEGSAAGLKITGEP